MNQINTKANETRANTPQATNPANSNGVKDQRANSQGVNRVNGQRKYENNPNKKNIFEIIYYDYNKKGYYIKYYTKPKDQPRPPY